MASVWADKRSGNWLIKFRLGGTPFTRSCLTTNEVAAKRIKASVEETIRFLNTGRLVIPNEVVDPALWVMSGGKVGSKPSIDASAPRHLGEICDAYFRDQLDKADTTLGGEKVHINHLKRLLGENTRFESLALTQMQSYVSARCKEPSHLGGTVSGGTVEKELTTFMQIWEWARQRGHVSRICPIKDPLNPRKWIVKIPKPIEDQKFKTWAEIEKRLGRGGIDDLAKKSIWKCLFLDEAQVAELLEHVRLSAPPFVYAMFAFAAFTGARRSEIRRSEIDDFDFSENLILIRERKRRKGMASTTRTIPMNPKLKEIMLQWSGVHPGGQYTIVPTPDMRRLGGLGSEMLTRAEAHDFFKEALAGSNWSVVRGFHVLRHSFGAICTRGGIPMNVIAKWMGHTTEEMMRLYQHLFPQDESQWMVKCPLGLR